MSFCVDDGVVMSSVAAPTVHLAASRGRRGGLVTGLVRFASVLLAASLIINLTQTRNCT